jgi:serine/threonine protein phosphatase PrpC
MGVCFGKSATSRPVVKTQVIRSSLAVIEDHKSEVRHLHSISMELPPPEALIRRKNSRRRNSYSRKAQALDAISVCGQPSVARQSGFFDKRVAAIGSGSSAAELAVRGLAYACKKGLKPNIPNQDDFIIHIETDCLLLGVFDGHGAQGHEVSHFIKSALPKLLLSDDNRRGRPLEVITQSFLKAQQELGQHCRESFGRIDCVESGSTGTVVLIQDRKLYTGYVGDSRAVLGYMKNGQLKARALTKDHKPNLPEEKARIRAAGGEIKRLPNDSSYRVFKRGEDFPGLAMSRAFGDIDAHHYGVTHDAEVKEHKLRPCDEFVIVASDGVWEFIINQEAVDLVSKQGRSGIRVAAESLAKLAWSRWRAKETEVVDDITVLIAYLT